MTQWSDPDRGGPASLGSLPVSPLTRSVLERRGIKDAATAQAFLHPESAPSTPFPGVEQMVDRLLSAARSHELICVWGDFDVDGQTSTALLVEALQLLGARVNYHVPLRATEGHGVHVHGLQNILDGGVNLILTCDTGITAHEAVAYANSRGADVLITDHHDAGTSLPDAFAIINPKLLPDGHALADLAGVGVAYKLAEALLAAVGVDPARLLDLVALGLIADLALLRNQTRVLAHKGIRGLRQTERLGLRVVAEQAQADLETATEETIGFILSPRLNALGRLGDANAAVELLLTHDAVRARVLAAQLESLNTHRRLLTEQVFQAAEQQIASDQSRLRHPILVLEHASWPGGVLGIVASKLVERYRKPAILLSRSSDGSWHGSARSIEGLHITNAIAGSRENLLNFGGHPMAAGLSLTDERLPQFKAEMQRTARRMLADAEIQDDVLQIDQWMDLRELNLDLAMDLDQLAPFGPGNPVPVLATRGLQIRSSRQLGSGNENRKLTVVDANGVQVEVLWWGAGSREAPSTQFDLAYCMRPVTYRGEHQLALTLIEFRIRADIAPALASADLEVVDKRATNATGLPPDCLVWVEGSERSIGVDRFHLQPAEKLAIWTSPPGRAELQAALSTVRPRAVYLVGRAPGVAQTLEEFLQRLAGLAKFAVSQRGGQTSITELAAACAQRELTVRIALEWLAANGHIVLRTDAELLRLSLGTGAAKSAPQEELLAGLRSLLEETAAFRTYFQTAPANALVASSVNAANPT